MKLVPGDFVEIVAIPSWVERLGAPEQQVYRTCLGFKLAIVRVDEDGRCVFQLGQEWDHFPGTTPFDLTVDAACLRKIEPFSDAEWEAISNWMQHDTPISGKVIAVDGSLKVRIDGSLVGDLALPDEASPTDYLGQTISVRIIMLNREKRDLVLYPAPA